MHGGRRGSREIAQGGVISEHVLVSSSRRRGEVIVAVVHCGVVVCESAGAIVLVA